MTCLAYVQALSLWITDCGMRRSSRLESKNIPAFALSILGHSMGADLGAKDEHPRSFDMSLLSLS